MGRGRVEEGLVGLAGCVGFGHGVVALQDEPLGAVLAVGRHVPPADDGEGVHDVVRVVAADSIQVKERGVDLSSQQFAPVVIPAEGRPGPAEIGGEAGQVPGGVGEFEDIRPQPFGEGSVQVPWCELVVGDRRQYRKLLEDEERQ
jgi:hypothetical protein